MFHGAEDGRTTVATQSSVLDAAVDEWSETAVVEVAAVARRAGVSAGLPYRHFGTRAGLLVALVEDFYGRQGHAAMMGVYDAPTWLQRERRRITDWMRFLDGEPLAPVLLRGPVGHGQVAAEHSRWLARLTETDPTMLAAATLFGVHAMSSLTLRTMPRPSAEEVAEQVRLFVAGAVGVPAGKDEYR
jgi:AcrR family transcriptional regulator